MLIALAIYLGIGTALTIGLAVATREKYRGRFTWLIQDEPEELRTWNG